MPVPLEPALALKPSPDCGSQLTCRVVVTGVVVGAVLSLANLYLASRTGWLFGLGATGFLLGYAVFRLLNWAGRARPLTRMEGNGLQTIANSAGYLPSPLI